MPGNDCMLSVHLQVANFIWTPTHVSVGKNAVLPITIYS